MRLTRLLATVCILLGAAVAAVPLLPYAESGPLLASLATIWRFVPISVSDLHPDPLQDLRKSGTIGATISAALFTFGVALLFIAIRRKTRSDAVPQTDAAPVSATASRPIRPQVQAPGSEIRSAIRKCRSAFISIACFSGLINVLMLTGSVFMLEIYDRVLPSRSVATLIGLCVIALGLYASQGALDYIRGRILAQIGRSIDENLGTRVFQLNANIPLRLGLRGENQQPLRDLDAIRTFLASSGPAAMFDLPWLPFYMLVIYSFHPLLGATALVGATVLVTITIVAEYLVRKPIQVANGHGAERAALVDASRRNAEVVTALGMTARLGAEFQASHANYLASQQRASDIAGSYGALSKTLRYILQSGMLALGATLVIQGQATGGIIIAGSILFGRALAPVDAVIANARNFINARQSWKRLSKLLDVLPAPFDPLPLHPPRKHLTVSGLTVAPPGTMMPVVHDVTFDVQAGQAIGVIGASGSGKSCLVRAIVGAWQPMRGRVQLDGAALNQWSSESLGRHLGYLPQDVELFAGTIAHNISRFEPDADPEAIIAAAKAAGVHDLITSFSDGYDTDVGQHGAALSAGQRQRIALARAIYRNPFLVVLDEPNSNLDTVGERALLSTIEGVKARGGIAIIVTHRQNVLAAANFIVAMQHGRAQVTQSSAKAFGRIHEAVATSGLDAVKFGSNAIPNTASMVASPPAITPPEPTTPAPVESPEAENKPRLRLAIARTAAGIEGPAG